MIESDRRIIEAEIARLEKLWQDAQERYGITGSASTDRTMTKYRVLQEALESVLNNTHVKTLERSWEHHMNQMQNLMQTVQRYAQAGRIPADVANVLINIIRG